MIEQRTIKTLYFLFVISLLFISSCHNDTSITPPIDSSYHYDSARFNWKTLALPTTGFNAGLWAKDTNDIYLTNLFNNRLYRIQDTNVTYTQYNSDIIIGFILNDPANNGYTIGQKKIGNIYQPYFQMFDGNSFTEIPNPQNFKEDHGYQTALVKNKNDIWIGGDGLVFHFDGSVFLKYDLEDTTAKVLKFFYDETNSFKILASIYHEDIVQTEFLVYEFNGTNWIMIYNDYKSPRPLKYNVLNKTLSATNLNTIFGISDSVLIPMVQIVPPGSKFVMNGSSFQNILLPASSRFENCNTTLFHWNGNKWSFELCGFSVDPTTDVYMINPDYFYVVAINQFDGTYIFRGIKK